MMYADEPRLFFLSHNPVLRSTQLASRHLCLDNSSVPSLRYNEPFIPPQARGDGSRSTHVSPSDVVVYSRRAANVQRRFNCQLSFCLTARPIVRRGKRPTETFPLSAVVLSIRLWPSCRARSAETILRSAVVLSFCRSVVLACCCCCCCDRLFS